MKSLFRAKRTFRSACGGLTASAVRQRTRLNQVARHYQVLANYCQRTRRPACDGRFDTIGQEMVLEAGALLAFGTMGTSTFY